MARGLGKVGIKDVAGAADVSVSTVSHVLNGTAPISAEVRERVLNAANALGYLAQRRNKAAISVLRTVLLAVPSDALPLNDYNLYSWSLLSALSRECERRAIRIVPFEIDKPGLGGAVLVEAARKAEADGILLLNDDRPELLREIAKSGIPAVLMNGEDHEMQVDSVTPGNRFAARHATDWLIGQGHRTILHMTWEGRATIRRRHDGFLEAFRVNGIAPDHARIALAEGFLPHLGERAMLAWLDQHDGLDGVTAIFCAADNLALGVIEALNRRGIAMPTDVSVVGFDGVALGEFTNPPLTTVAVPLQHMGMSALNLLELRIVNATLSPPAHRLELGCRLIVRKSVRSLP
ncbi:transcriptional regulator, LacI family [Devosia lucknowensis]|uniref:Transcriptional regulator, LacI family n=1 Tax=Devosia lucknowensis TaxID=1096929 RepID=A0A1Y6EKZ1_9HYPH|nr:LacI family DNA-binding transcriptional regulator [Devosia lucknowensis]SMQ62999.1 transcriptional regulator, LacI family [Devosia lucknowensis]